MIDNFIPKKQQEAFKHFIQAFGCAWLPTEALSNLWDKAKYVTDNYGLIILLISVATGCFWAYAKSKKTEEISFTLNDTQTDIKIATGDLFEKDGVSAIPVNEFFDSIVDGLIVDGQSIHGKFISDQLVGDTQKFDTSVQSTINSAHIDVIEKKGKKRRFPIGSSAVVKTDNTKFIPFALTTTDPVTHEASASLPQLTEALTALWQRMRSEAGHQNVNVPLIGSGLSRTNLSTTNLLDLLLMTLQSQSRQKLVANKVRIILYGKTVEDLDLNLIKKEWSK